MKLGEWKASRIGRKLIVKILAVWFTVFILTLIVSYFTLVPPLQKQAIDNARNVNRQIVQQADLVLSDIKTYTENVPYDIGFRSAYQNYIQDPQNEQLYQLVCQHLNRLAGMSTRIRNITVESQNGQKRFTSIVQVNQLENSFLKSDWYLSLRKSEYASGFSSGFEVTDHVGGIDANVYSAAYCKNFYINNEWLTVTVFFRCNSILDTSVSLSAKKLNYQIWTDASFIPLFSNTQSHWSDAALKRLQDKDAAYSSLFKEYDGYNFVQLSEQSDWAFVSYVSQQALRNEYLSYVMMIVFIFIALFVVIAVTTPLIITSITKPISSLASTMVEVSKGNLEVMSTVCTDDEIGELSTIFNSMVVDLKAYIDKLFEKENLEQRMKYSLLISQIDPHFIYNTMNTINVLARRERYTDIIAINTALIKILQDRLRVKNIAVFDTIEQEVGVLKQYIVIQNYRYQNRIQVSWDIPEDLYQREIPKNIIQPLVENAFFHGMIDENGEEINGHIHVSISPEGGNIIIRVADDGNGISQEKLELLNSSGREESAETRGKHIGLANIRKRLAYLYGTNNCMKIESSPSSGTCVTITITEQKITD